MGGLTTTVPDSPTDTEEAGFEVDSEVGERESHFLRRALAVSGQIGLLRSYSLGVRDGMGMGVTVGLGN